jgi:hypothetical protein|tara:strand:- start:1332 stop:1547 length:216 start_codon:yes stop_codon:yes gene_type:complete
MIYPIELLKRHLTALEAQLKSLHLLKEEGQELDIKALKKEMSDRMLEVELSISILEYELEEDNTEVNEVVD